MARLSFSTSAHGAGRNLASGWACHDGPFRIIAHELLMRLAEPQPVIDHPFPSASMATDDAPVVPAPTANRDDAATKAQNSGSET
jgi:hypothetical protein